MRIIFNLFIVAVFVLTQSCFTVAPKQIRERNIDVQVNEDKIKIMVETCYNAKMYNVREVTLVNTLQPERWTILKLYPYNEELIFEGMMQHPSFGYRVHFFEYYIHEGLYVIEINKLQIPNEFVSFNLIAVLFQSPFEEYVYEMDELIHLFPKVSEN